MSTAKRITTAFALSLTVAAWAGCSAQSGGSLTDGSGASPGSGAGATPGTDGTNPDPSGTGTNNGGSTTTTPTTGDAKSLFTSKVYPLLKTGEPQGKTQCTACHVSGVSGATIFLGADAESSYTAMQTQGMISSPANSKLLLHGEHTGPALTAEQAGAITSWLNAETAAKGLPGGTGTGTGTTADGGTTTVGPIQTLASSLDGFASCMDITDWNTNGLQNLYNTQTNAGNGNPSCGDCHAQGDGGNYMSTNQQQTFDMNKVFPYIKRMVSGTVDPNTGAFKGLVAAKRWELKGVESQTCNRATQNCHPRYTLNTNQINGINAFVSKTLTKLANGQCGTTAGSDAGK